MVADLKRSARRQDRRTRRSGIRSQRTRQKDEPQPSNWVQLLTAVGTALTALIALSGLYYTNRNLDETQRQINVAQDGQRADRFGKAVELLGSESVDTRLGGIYALGNLAKESPKDHVAAVDVLAAYVRGHAPLARDCELPKTRESPLPIPDVQVALAVLGNRNVSHDKENYINLADRCFVGVNLDGGNYSGFSFARSIIWRSSARRANFSKANFEEATMQHVDFAGADLTCVYRQQWYNADGSDMSEIVLRSPEKEDPGRYCH